MTRHTVILFYMFFMCNVYGTIHQQVQIIHEDLKQIELLLKEYLTNQTVNIIERNLGQAKEKITSLEKAFSTSDEKGNPFLPDFIQETKEKIDGLEAKLTIQKKLLKKPGFDNDSQAGLQLLEQWYTYQINSINSFGKMTEPPSNPFTQPIQNDLLALAKKKENNNQNALQAFYTNAIQALEENLKTIQNAFFDFSLNYQSTCDQAFNNIIHLVMSTKPPVPKRSSSLSKKIVPSKPVEELINKPPIEKSFLEKIQKKTEQFTKTIEQKVSQAKEFAAQHISSIEQSIGNIQKSESSLSSTQQTKNVLEKEYNNPLINSKALVDIIYQASSSYNTLRFYGLHLNMLHRLMNFIALQNMPLFNFNRVQLTQMADNTAIIIQKLIHSLITKKNELYANNIFHAELYYATFVLPTLFYSMLINNKLSWVSDKARLLCNKIEIYLEKNKHTPYTFDLLSNEQIEECISYGKTILERQSLLLPEELLNAYFFLHALTTITGADHNKVIELQTMVNNNIIDYIKRIKNNILSFIHDSLFKTIALPFDLPIQLYNNVFITFSEVKSIELFSLLYKTSPHTGLSKKVYQETVLAKQAIYNAFKECTKKTKNKIDKNSGLRTAWTILHEQLERIVVLLKPTIEK